MKVLVALSATVLTALALVYIAGGRDGYPTLLLLDVPLREAQAQDLAAPKAPGKRLPRSQNGSQLFDDVSYAERLTIPDARELGEGVTAVTAARLCQLAVVISDEDVRGALVEAMVLFHSEGSRPNLAALLAQGCNDPAMVQAGIQLAEIWSRQNAESAIQWVQSCQPGNNRAAFTEKVFQVWGKTDPVVASALVPSLAPGDQDSAWGGLAKAKMESEPMEAARYAVKIQDVDARTNVLRWVYSDLYALSTSRAEQWLQRQTHLSPMERAHLLDFALSQVGSQ